MDLHTNLGDGSESVAGHYNPQPYLEALQHLKQRSDFRIKAIRVVIVVALLISLPWAIRLYINLSGFTTTMFWLGVFVVAMIALPVFFPRLMSGWQMNKLSEMLTHSGLADRIALGELDLNDPIFEHTPWYCRWLMPRNPGKDPRKTISRVAASLQWYAAAPRIHIKPTWIMPIAILPMLLMFGPQFMFRSPLRGPTFDPVMLMPLLFLIGMPVALVAMQHVMLSILSAYLEQAWEITNSAEIADSGESVEPGHSLSALELERRTKLQQTINQVQQDIEQGLMQLLMPVTMMWVFGLMPAMMSAMMSGLFSSGSLLPMVGFILVPMIPMFGSIKLATAGFKAYRRQIREKIETSGIAIAIASGELDYTGPIDHTPLLLRWVHSIPRMPKGFADELRMRIWRAAFNLDWYMDHPRPLIRPAWICNMLLGATAAFSLALMILAPIALMNRAISSHASVPTSFNMFANPYSVWLVPLVIGLGIPGLLHATRTRIWAEELIRHLRERLAG